MNIIVVFHDPASDRARALSEHLNKLVTAPLGSDVWYVKVDCDADRLIVYYDDHPRDGDRRPMATLLRTDTHRRLVLIRHHSTLKSFPSLYAAQGSWVRELVPDLPCITRDYHHEHTDPVYTEVLRMLTSRTASAMAWEHAIVPPNEGERMRHAVRAPLSAISLKARLANQASGDERGRLHSEIASMMPEAVRTARQRAREFFASRLQSPEAVDHLVNSLIPPPPPHGSDFILWMDQLELSMDRLDKDPTWRAPESGY